MSCIAIVKRPYLQDGASSRVDDYVVQLIIGLMQRGECVLLPDTQEHQAFIQRSLPNIGDHGLCQIVPEADARKRARAVIAVGGDGTMLQAMKMLRGVPVLGVNMGHLGFITDVPMSCNVDDILDILYSESVVERRTMLSCNELGETVYAMNDIVISRKQGHIITLRVTIDGEFAFDARADGVIIATPTGSTAYALSAGGSIVAPTSKVFQIVPICPQTLAHRPLIVNDDAKILVEVMSGEADVFVDGALTSTFDKKRVTVNIFKPSITAQIVHPTKQHIEYSYFNTLRTKLNWQYLPGSA